jgi:hypothetical protein
VSGHGITAPGCPPRATSAASTPRAKQQCVRTGIGQNRDLSCTIVSLTLLQWIAGGMIPPVLSLHFAPGAPASTASTASTASSLPWRIGRTRKSRRGKRCWPSACRGSETIAPSSSCCGTTTLCLTWEPYANVKGSPEALQDLLAGEVPKKYESYFRDFMAEDPRPTCG